MITTHQLNERVNKLLFSEGKGIAELTDFNISLSTSLHGEKKKREADTHPIDTTANVGTQPAAFQQNGFHGIYDEERPDFSIPWNLGLSFSFAQNQENPTAKSRSANLNANLGFNLTENWKFSATGSYDVINRQVAAPRITIDRDLHCWTMNFSWVPSGALPRLPVRAETKSSAVAGHQADEAKHQQRILIRVKN